MVILVYLKEMLIFQFSYLIVSGTPDVSASKGF